MNKKFLSVILFSALMVGTAGTFTSCKDYDDDIENLDKKTSDLNTQLTTLQSALDAAKSDIAAAKSAADAAKEAAATAKAEAIHGGRCGDHAGARDARHAEGACAHVWLPAECGGRRTY